MRNAISVWRHGADNPPMRWIAWGAWALVAMGALAGEAPFPAHPIRIVVPFGAGGIADLTARIVGERMSEGLGQPVVIENRPGAGGVVAAQGVARSEPDGYTLLLVSNGNAVSAGLMRSLPYDTLKDFAPISTLAFFDLVIVVRHDSPMQSLQDLVAFAREHPGKLNIGSINVGSTQNLAAELFKSRAGIAGQVVPFNGTPALVAALLGGSVDVALEILGPVSGQIASGKLRALASTGATRRPELPGVPTAMEAGIADFDVASWNGLAAPAATPPDVLARLNRAANAAVSAPDVKRRMSEIGVDARGSTAQELRALLASEIRRWGEVIDKAGIPRQ
jgi:tripartite-type tricarboxylate transporter receptor subunit TctC